MTARTGLIGRHAELARLEAALQRADLGEGSIVLLSGEAGVGKSRLAADVAARSNAVLLRGAPSQGGAAPYGPVVAALRSHLRSNPTGLEDCGPLRAQLALLLPELGEPAPAADRQTLFEAIRCAFAHVAAERHALVVLDDLQWSDAATLELLSALAEPLGQLSVLVIAAYRSDGLPRDHGVRRLRNDLRRTGHLDELVLGPLDLQETDRPRRAVARRRSRSIPGPRDPRPHRGDRLLRRGAGRRAAHQRCGAARAARARARRRRRRADPRHGPRRGAHQRVRAVGGGSDGRRGRRGRGRDVRSRSDRRALERCRTVRARRPRGRRRGRVRRGRVPACAHARGALCRRVVDTAAGAASRARGRARARRRAESGDRAPLARRACRRARARGAAARRRRSPRRCTPIATRPRRTGRRWSCGPRAGTTTAAGTCWSATRAARGSPVSSPRPRAPGASSARSAAPPATSAPWPTRSASSPLCTS